MKKSLLPFLIVLFLFPAGAIHAQGVPRKGLPSDEDLLALVQKHLHTPVNRTVRANGDVFLQRNMDTYLQAAGNPAPPVSAAEADHGHDHKDAMLRTFLNRPHPDVATMNRYFNTAAAEFKVPLILLKATAQVQSNWAQVSESIYGSWGVTGLIENPFVQQVSQAAALLHVTADQVKNDAKTNIRAAAALLAFYQSSKPASAKIEDWFESVQSLTGLWDADLKKDLALRIYEVIKAGSKSVTLWGEIILIAHGGFPAGSNDRNGAEFCTHSRCRLSPRGSQFYFLQLQRPPCRQRDKILFCALHSHRNLPGGHQLV
jgi:hypothetical protein